MLSLPDFREKQIVYIHAEWNHSSRVRFQNDNIVFEKDGKVVSRVSVHKAFCVFICGDLALSTQIIRKAREHGVSLYLLKHNFEMYAGLLTAADGHYVLRMKQYSLPPDQGLAMAKKLISNKINNQSKLLQEKASSRNRNSIRKRFDAYAKQALVCATNDKLLGIEGIVSKTFFSEYYKDIGWRRRAPRTKEDVPNLLLDIGYTFLFHFVDALLRLHGFDTYKGFYHKLFFQRRSLACDLVEPMRCIIDKQLLKAYNRKQIVEDDFDFRNGAFSLPFDKQPKYAGMFLECLMKRREGIYTCIHDFYRHIMNPDDNPFPTYTQRSP